MTVSPKRPRRAAGRGGGELTPSANKGGQAAAATDGDCAGAAADV